MIYWAFISFAVALTSGLFGFGGEATAVAGLAQALFFVFFSIAIVLTALRLAADFDAQDHTRRD